MARLDESAEADSIGTRVAKIQEKQYENTDGANVA